ncbi:MAG: adenylate/guanylate cyclase domain-containing protein, partial [Proteobacteria bacterium]|nr:adenylate/guanylate cyclase domain-containing protein [Pseudomonadota bacterium]
FDILYTEPQVARTPEGELGEDDFALANSTAESGIVIHAAQFLEDMEDEKNKSILNRPLADIYIENNAIKNFHLKKGARTKSANNYYVPLPELYSTARSVGIVEFGADGDGVYRRSHLLRGYQGNYYPVLSFAVIEDIWSPKSVVLEKNKLVVDSVTIPLQRDGSYLINMKKHFNTFSIGGIFASIQKMQTGEFDDLLVNPEDFQDKIVIVGASAAGIEDLKHTSMGSDVPGVLLHGSVISNILDQDFINKASEWVVFVFVFLICSIIAFVILRYQSVTVQGVVPAAATLIYIIVSYFLIDRYRLWIPLIAPIMAFATVFIGSFAYMSVTEGKERRKTRKMLSQYVSPAVLSEVMDKSDSALTAEVGANEELTILFSDIRSFTSFSEAVEASQVVEQLNFYLEEMVEVVFEFKGTLDKFIGDAVMAFWGAPILTETHAKQGVLAALDMIHRLKNVNKHFEEKGYPLFKIGVGLHTGNVILGNIGSEKKLDYTVIGDGVNLASRMEGLTKEYGCQILISEMTFRQIGRDIPCRVVDSVRVKGKEQPIRIYSPLASPQSSPEELELGLQIAAKTDKAFQYYQNQDWEKSIQLYREILENLVDDKTCLNVIKRCEEFIKDPPPENWDGCYTMKTK